MLFLNPLAFVAIIFVVVAFWCIIKIKNNEDILLQTKLMLLSLVLLLIAWSRPVIEHQNNTQELYSKEIVIALDISYSMMAQDVKPNRYSVAKEVIQKVLQKIPTSRVTLFVFTANPLMITPPTLDHEVAQNALDAIHPEYVLSKSTSITNLLEAITQLEKTPKELLFFSDGGEEKDLALMVQNAKKANLHVNVVAVGSKQGALLYKDGVALQNKKGELVISRINPLLKQLAHTTGGFYIPLESNKDISMTIIDKLQTASSQKISFTTYSYTELYPYPLVVAFVVLLVAYTQLLNRWILVGLLMVFFPLKGYSDDGFSLYKNKHYLQAAQAFLALPPSSKSYYNAAVAFYKAKRYKKALTLLSQIKTPDKTFKANIFYNMGNCAVALQKYSRAKVLYQKALWLNPNDKDAKANLLLLYRYNLKDGVDVADMMPHVNDTSSTTTSASNEQPQQQQKQGSSNNSQNARSSGSVSSSAKVAQKQTKYKHSATHSMQFGYSAYELINKGYINETKPW